MAPTYVVMDFETFFGGDYTLTKMTPIEYVLDRRFEMNVVAVTEDDNGAEMVMEHDEFVKYVSYLRGKNVAVVSHNALFDMCILAWRYGWVPPLMIDTMGMARALIYPQTGSVSLATCLKYFGIGVKGTHLNNVRNMYKAEIKARGLWAGHCQYALDDAVGERELFKKVRPYFPRSEYEVMDQVLRCTVIPPFELDRPLLVEHYNDVMVEKQKLIMECGLEDREVLMSNDKFADLLRQHGVEPPMKTSPKTGLSAYAFAKSDKDFIDLYENHPNPKVQMLVAARLGHKTTLEETRTARFISVADLTWADGSKAKMPMPLRYSGAHTHRFSGDWSLNVQNLRRGSKLRQSLKAPKGKRVVAVDASQIEARINPWFSGQTDLVDAFRRGEDIYSMFSGDEIYGYPVSKKTHPEERFVGKQSILGLGYNMGGPKFQNTVRVQSRNELKRELIIPEEECIRIVQAYRRRYSRITQMWRTLQNMLPSMCMDGFELQLGPITLLKNAIRLPNGLMLQYHELQNCGDGQWMFKFGKMTKFIYGGKMLENIVQALARICTMEAAVRIKRRWHNYNISLGLQVHDELVYVVPEEIADEFLASCIEEMRVPPAWGLDIPLDAEGGMGLTYGDVK